MMLRLRASTQQYVSDAVRLIWVVMCLKNIIEKEAQNTDIIE